MRMIDNNSRRDLNAEKNQQSVIIEICSKAIKERIIWTLIRVQHPELMEEHHPNLYSEHCVNHL